MRAQQVPIELAPLDVNGLIGAAVQRRHAQAKQSHIELLFEPELGLPSVLLDAALIGEVIDRLLDNALNYTPHGGCIMLTTEFDQTRDQPGVLITVQDNGPGIPPAELPRLFEGFHRGSASANFATPGAGLGLAISHEIILQHQGQIEVVSQVGQGSTFRVWLPVNQAIETPPQQG